MRFAIAFAGCLIAFAIDSESVFSIFPYFLIILVLAVLLYIDIITLSLEKVEDLKKIIEDKNNKKSSG